MPTLTDSAKKRTMIILNCCFTDNTPKFDLATIVALVTASTALLTGIYSIYHSRKTTFINAITTSRLKYIETLRSYISEFCGLVLHTSSTKLDEPTKKEINEKLDRLRFTIKLHLNRKNFFDKKLLDELDSISNFPNKENQEDIKNKINQLTNFAQDIFTLEWDGIQLEVAKGRLYWWQKYFFIKRHKQTYGK